MTQEPTKEFTRDDYAACVNTDFDVYFTPEYKVMMKLIEVTEEVEKFRQRSYVLTFAAPEDSPIAQGIMKVENEKLGQAEIFLVPVGKDDRGALFEAVFNRLLDRPGAPQEGK